METGRTIAFYGVGQMGVPMIARLAAAGHHVRAWNRTFEKAKAVAGGNVVAVEDPRDAAEGADIAISILTDGPAVLALVEENGLAEALPEGAAFVDMSSAKPEEATRLASILARGAVGFCDAPVSGGPPGAEAGTLAIMAGCDEAVFEQVAPVLCAMGRPVRLGPVGTGQLAKLANQLIVGAAIGAVAEAILLVKEGGGDTEAFRDALTGGYADSKVLQMHGARMAAGDFEPRGPRCPAQEGHGQYPRRGRKARSRPADVENAGRALHAAMHRARRRRSRPLRAVSRTARPERRQTMTAAPRVTQAMTT